MKACFVCLVVVALGLVGCAGSDLERRQTVGSLDRTELIDYDSPEGELLLRNAESIGDFLRLSVYFETQQNTAYCGVASAAMALNTLGSPRPISEQHGGVAFATQDNFFTDNTEEVLASSKVRRSGMTLQQLADALQTHGVVAEPHFADGLSLSAMSQLIRSSLLDSDRVVLVNYHRPAIGQPGPGHISPIAAFEPDSNRFLVLDVSRYKHVPVWVHEEVLWQGMLAFDGESERSRGIVVVSDPALR